MYDSWHIIMIMGLCWLDKQWGFSLIVIDHLTMNLCQVNCTKVKVDLRLHWASTCRLLLTREEKGEGGVCNIFSSKDTHSLTQICLCQLVAPTQTNTFWCWWADYILHSHSGTPNQYPHITLFFTCTCIVICIL